MIPITKEQKQYIIDNHEYQTQTELAANCGLSDGSVKNVCIEYNIRPINARDRANKYILDHPHLTLKQLAERLEMKEGSVYAYCRALKHTPAPAAKKEIVIEQPKISYTESIKKAHQTEMLLQYIDMMVRRDEILNKEPRFKDKYNQTRSSFTDELNGIQTTKREKTLYE